MRVETPSSSRGDEHLLFMLSHDHHLGVSGSTVTIIHVLHVDSCSCVLAAAHYSTMRLLRVIGIRLSCSSHE